MKKSDVVVIIPAYNEAEYPGGVLKFISSSGYRYIPFTTVSIQRIYLDLDCGLHLLNTLQMGLYMNFPFGISDFRIFLAWNKAFGIHSFGYSGVLL